MNTNLKVKSAGSYTKMVETPEGLKPELRRIYHVTGPEEELKAYCEAQKKAGLPDNRIKDEKGNVLMFANKLVPNNSEVQISKDGRYFPNNGYWEQVRALQADGYSLEAAKEIIAQA